MQGDDESPDRWPRAKRPGVDRARARSSVFRVLVTLVSLVLWTALPLAVIVSAAGSDAAPREPNRFDRVVIDAGHGGEDDGATGRGGLTEKELVLDISRRVARGLESRGIKVLLTRSDDTFVPLEERTSRANDARADLFVSIHANSSTNSKPSGVETYFVSLDATDDAAAQLALRENEAFGEEAKKPVVDDPLTLLLGDMIVNEYVRESSEFSKLVQHELSEVTATPSRGVKQAPFVVLMGVQMPAALIEIGFVSNRDEERKLRQAAHRAKLSKAIVRAVLAFGERADARRGVDESVSLFDGG